MNNNIKNYILNTTMYDKFYAVINKETGKEVFKISKNGNSIEDIKKAFPEIEVDNTKEFEKEKTTIVPVRDDAIQVAPGLWFIDGKYYDTNGKEYISPEEYYEEFDDDED